MNTSVTVSRILIIRNSFASASRILPRPRSISSIAISRSYIPDTLQIKNHERSQLKLQLPLTSTRARGGCREYLSRFYTTGTSKNLTYEEFSALVKNGDLQLFDVREPQECQSTGVIPGAINIPMGKLGQALLLPPDEFKEKYHIDKPEKMDTDIVFYCLAGVRSAGAITMAETVGFKNSRHFAGGWSEWAKRQNGRDDTTKD